MERLPTEQEFKEWMEHPVSVAVRRMLRLWRQDLLEQWAAGQFQAPSPQETAVANAQAIGIVRTYEQIEELDYATFESILTGEVVEPVGIDALRSRRAGEAVRARDSEEPDYHP